MDKRNAIAYCRCSTQGQVGEDKFGLDAQKDAIREYAQANNFKIVAWCEDVVSGVSDDRPELNKILYGDDVANPPFEAVIVFKSDRVARDIQLYFHYSFLLRRKGVELIAVNDSFKDVPAEYKNVIQSFVIFSAEQERKNIAMRTSHGRRIKAINGGYAGGRVPFGYNVIDGALVPNEVEAQIICEIFKLADDNVKQADIVRYLNDNGFRSKTGGEWKQNKIAYIIKNRKLYQGYIKYGKDAKWVQGVHTPIID